MRILQICRDFIPSLGGAINNIYNTNLKLSEKHEVSILTTNYSYKGNYKNYKKFEVIDRINVYRINFSKKSVINLFNFIKYIIKKRLFYADIINVHSNLTLLAAIPFKIIFKKAIVYEIHGGHIICPTFELYNYWTKSPCNLILNKKNCQKCYKLYKKRFNKRRKIDFFNLRFVINLIAVKFVDKFIAQTRFMKKIHEVIINPKKISVIYNGVSDLYSKFSKNPINLYKNKYIITYVGRINKVKGLDILIDSIKYLKEIENIAVLIVGDGSDWNYFKKKIQELDLDDKIKMIGRKDQNEIFNIYYNSKVIIVPSIYHESSPNVILEAMSIGTPVIASSVGGIPELIINNYDGILINNITPKKLAEKILFIYKNEEFRNNLAKNARQKITNKFSWEKRANHFIECYNKVLKKYK
ncbi:MAG: glycosyltransferase family 4 protein [Candidatus Helarchaeota archaeon]